MKKNFITHYILLALTLALIGAGFWSCSKDKNPLPSKSHTEDWNNPESENFHGLKVVELGENSCKSCHGLDFLGGDSKVSCFSCHATYPHMKEWMVISSAMFHGAVLKNNAWDTKNCSECHGEAFQGGNSKVSCYTCHSTFPHKAEWMDESSDQFHGAFVQNNDWDTKACGSCHGEDFKGGSTGVSCYDCHAIFPHPANWLNSDSEEFHGHVLRNNDWDVSSCATCHGNDFQGGETKVSCYTCHSSFPHDADWLQASSDKFHGTFLQNNGWDTESCAACHGQDYQGGDVGVSCYTCHSAFPHSSNWVNNSSDEFHGNFIRQGGWSLASCKTCHAEDYSGGNTGVACAQCHTQEGGPEACNTCHGNADHIYPPRDLSNNTATTAIGVGAHEEHMELFNNCDLCHVVPASFDDPSHIDGPPAEVKDAWQWDRNTATCAASCHGDSKIWNNF